MPQETLDRWQRPLRNLRLSVTDRCNIRCQYCMPEEHYLWLPRESILTFEEIIRVLRAFSELGVSKVRITGGEPLMRHELPDLIGMISDLGSISDTALTTNGVMLPQLVGQLKEAGLGRITVSLDSLDPDRYREFTGSGRHADVLSGIRSLAEAGFEETKINSVVVRGFNEDEIPALVEMAAENGAEPRFIEYMDVGGATGWTAEKVVSRAEILDVLAGAFGGVEPVEEARGSAPAERFLLPGGVVVGVVASTTTPFCAECDRARLTADGHLYLCLYADRGIDLKEVLRSGASDEELGEFLTGVWQARDDRGAMDRVNAAERTPLYQLESLRAKPHREMHTRGG